jgi:hypothetical protein
VGDKVQKLGHFGLEGEGLLAHRCGVVSKNGGCLMGAGAGRPDDLQLWAMRLHFKATAVDLGLRCAS